MRKSVYDELCKEALERLSNTRRHIKNRIGGLLWDIKKKY